MPVKSERIRTEKSPRLTATSTSKKGAGIVKCRSFMVLPVEALIRSLFARKSTRLCAHGIPLFEQT